MTRVPIEIKPGRFIDGSAAPSGHLGERLPDTGAPSPWFADRMAACRACPHAIGPDAQGCRLWTGRISDSFAERADQCRFRSYRRTPGAVCPDAPPRWRPVPPLPPAAEVDTPVRAPAPLPAPDPTEATNGPESAQESET